MPIRPENRGRYPANWREIRAAILARAENRCEWPGCGAPDRIRICRSDADPERWTLARDASQLGVVVVLTIAHLDHQPENNDPANLRALCQLHHLRYDRLHHAESARRERERRTGQLALAFELPSAPPLLLFVLGADRIAWGRSAREAAAHLGREFSRVGPNWQPCIRVAAAELERLTLLARAAGQDVALLGELLGGPREWAEALA